MKVDPQGVVWALRRAVAGRREREADFLAGEIARLIEAGDAMEEALKACLPFVVAKPEIIEQAHAALAKARGED